MRENPSSPRLSHWHLHIIILLSLLHLRDSPA